MQSEFDSGELGGFGGFGGNGYRLKYFEIYNWGIFDGRIYRAECNGESTLLTGANGSGKTTLVDAILSLLVPSRHRFYNQSSGAEQRKDRSEESYVRGAYKSMKGEEYSQAVQEFLRGKECYSVLLGVFSNSGAESDVTLTQLRFFGSDGRLQQVYSVTHREISLEDINAAIGEFDRAGKWKKTLTERFDTVFYGDSFLKYSEAFSRIFGFRSEKALHLFAQTVGLKVLGNLNEFIRSRMLEQLDTESEFQKLYKNYGDLLASHNEIEKTREEIALLEPVLAVGEKWEKETARMGELERLVTAIPAWYALRGTELIEREQDRARESLALAEGKNRALSADQDRVERDIFSLKMAIENNEAARRLTEIQHRLEMAERDNLQCIEDRRRYETRAALVELPMPSSGAAFTRNRQKLAGLRDSELKKREALEEKNLTLRMASEKIRTESALIADELASLSGRSSNIPLENVRIRKFICEGVKCDESALPFAGELLRVADDERDWEPAIGKLLRHFALCVLVDEERYAAVNKFVQTHNLRGRVVYLRTGSPVAAIGRGARPAADTVPGKVRVKGDHPLAEWVAACLQEHFDYLCTDDLAAFARARRAITSSGLVKNDIRHEKDDRPTKPGHSDRVIGWDNQAKKAELSTRYRQLRGESESTDREIAALSGEREKSGDRLRVIAELEETADWSAIDTAVVTRRIDDLMEEKNALLKDSKDLRQMEVRLAGMQERLRAIRADRDAVQGEIGALGNRLDEFRVRHEELLRARELYREDEVAEFLEGLSARAPKNESLKTLAELDAAQASVRAGLDAETTTSRNRLAQLGGAMTKAMYALVMAPRETLDRYPGWTADMRDLVCEGTSLADFRVLHARLVKDDLPRYLTKFRQYLNDRLLEDVISFNTTLTGAEQEIREGIRELNVSLRAIPYSRNPPTHIQLEERPSADQQIKEFRALLSGAIMDAGLLTRRDERAVEEAFARVRALIERIQENDAYRKKMLDVRNWFVFAAAEYYEESGEQKQYYQDSASLSGGEKAKLAYTILASAIAFQFGIRDEENRSRSFRFVIIDEAFSKIDPENSRYAMELFKHLDLQLMVVTPMDKINIVEEYVSSVHLAENKGTLDSRLLGMTIERYQEMKKSHDNP